MQSVPMHRRVALAALLAIPTPALAGGVRGVGDFGAVPGDGLDDRPAFQAALDAARPGDTVTVPAGAFDLSGAVNLRGGVTLAGAGADATVLRRIGPARTEFLRASRVSDAAVVGLALDGQRNDRATQGIVAEYSRGLSIDRIAVRDLVARPPAPGESPEFGPAGVYGSIDVKDSSVTNSTFTRIGEASVWGAGVRFLGGSDGVRVEGNAVAGTGRGGIMFNRSTDAVVRRNTVTGSGTAPGAPALGIELFDRSHRGVVEDNRLDHWLSVDNSHAVAVRRNVVDDAARPGYVALAGLELAGASHDAVFADNVVAGGSHVGWSVSNVGERDRVLFARNAVRGSETFGVQVQADGAGEAGANRRFVLVGNEVSGGRSDAPIFGAPGESGDGVRLNAAAGPIRDVHLAGNAITGNAGKAFDLLGPGGVFDLDLSGNAVSGNGDDALPPSLPGPGPSADLTIAPAGPPGTFAFAADFLDAGGSPFAPDAVLWDFGSGVPETGPGDRAHAYADPGLYRVTVVGWDATGRAAVASGEVAVVVPEPAASAVLLAAPLLLARRGRR